jgi:hypothetical protein
VTNEISSLRYNHYLKTLRKLQDKVTAQVRALAKLRLSSSQISKKNTGVSEIPYTPRRATDTNRRMPSSTRAKSSAQSSGDFRIKKVEALRREHSRNVQSANSRKHDKRIQLKLANQADEEQRAQAMLLEWKDEVTHQWRAERKARLDSEDAARSRSINTSFVESRLTRRDTEDSDDKEIERRLLKFRTKLEQSTVKHLKSLQLKSERARSCYSARNLAHNPRLDEEGRLLHYISKVKAKSREERTKRIIANEERKKSMRMKEGKLSQVRQRIDEEQKRRLSRAAELDESYYKDVQEVSQKSRVRQQSQSFSQEVKRLHIEDTRVRAICQHRAHLYKQELLLRKHVNDSKRVAALKQLRGNHAIRRLIEHR